MTDYEDATMLCPDHGQQIVSLETSVPGFTGAMIYFIDLACGCQITDASDDTLENVR